jgi:hypothetical protein
MASYAGVDFYERGNAAGLSVPGWNSKFVLVEKIIPNGEPVIQRIGAQAQRMAMPIRCTADQLDSLRGSVDGSSGTLSWSGGSDSAILESIDTPLEVRPGVDMYFVTLNFIKTS